MNCNRKIDLRSNQFYPLVVLQTTVNTNDKTGKTWSDRRVVRSRKWDGRWYGKYLPALFGRQVGKLAARKGKPLMELPYSLETCETLECEIEYSKHSPNINVPRAKNKDVDVEAVVDAEMEGMA